MYICTCNDGEYFAFDEIIVTFITVAHVSTYTFNLSIGPYTKIHTHRVGMK